MGATFWQSLQICYWQMTDRLPSAVCYLLRYDYVCFLQIWIYFLSAICRLSSVTLPLMDQDQQNQLEANCNTHAICVVELQTGKRLVYQLHSAQLFGPLNSHMRAGST